MKHDGGQNGYSQTSVGLQLHTSNQYIHNSSERPYLDFSSTAYGRTMGGQSAAEPCRAVPNKVRQQCTATMYGNNARQQRTAKTHVDNVRQQCMATT